MGRLHFLGKVLIPQVHRDSCHEHEHVGQADDGQGEGETCQGQEERNIFLEGKDFRLLQAQVGRSDRQVSHEVAQGAGRGCKTRKIEKGGVAKDPVRSRYGGGAGSRQGA